MTNTLNNCIIYSKDAELIGKLIMQGHIVHYDNNIIDLIKQIGEIHPDLIILDDLFKEIDPSYISVLIQVQWRIIIRGSLPMKLLSELDNKKVICLPVETTNDVIIEKINFLNKKWNEEAHPAKPKILIIEDNPDILEMYSVAFVSKWYDISLATDGLSGMTKAVTFRPEIIILDIMMPHMDGFEVLHTLKNNTSIQATIIVNTNLEWVDEEKRVKALWADYFLRKSHYTPLDVVGIVEKELHK